MRKSEEIKINKIEVINKLKEIETLETEIIKEENEKLQDAISSIEKICTKNNLFCGVVLTTQDLLEVIKIAIESKENVSIPFRVYFKD